VFFIYFFQAEDGIRDRNVTGVQTCALPIFREVQADMTIAVKESNENNAYVKKGTEKMYQVGQTFQEINNAIEEEDHYIHGITESINVIQQEIERINSQFGQITKIATVNATETNQVVGQSE